MRLIDSDALTDRIEADKKQDNISPGNFFLFKAYIMNAPTIEHDTDTISRSQAIKDVSEWATDILHPDKLIKEDAIHILESLPSAEQVTGKLKNPCDSLLTADSEACKEQKSKLDLISRRAVLDAINGTFWSGIEKTIKNIPSAESTGAMDEAIQKYIKDGYMQPIGEDLISRQDAIAYFFRPYSNEELYSNIDIEKALNALPSAKQVTGKLNNPDDSLLTGGSDTCKESGSKLESAEAVQGWIPIKYHEITEIERKENGYPKDWVYFLDCEMPQDGQEILVQAKNGEIRWDVCYEDDGFSLDSGWDWKDDIIAWMPLPDPYKGGDDE